jgi:hypothetical protein
MFLNLCCHRIHARAMFSAFCIICICSSGWPLPALAALPQYVANATCTPRDTYWTRRMEIFEIPTDPQNTSRRSGAPSPPLPPPPFGAAPPCVGEVCCAWSCRTRIRESAAPSQSEAVCTTTSATYTAAAQQARSDGGEGTGSPIANESKGVLHTHRGGFWRQLRCAPSHSNDRIARRPR